MGGFFDARARWLVEDFGLAGLFLVALLDSSFLSLPEINDLLVMTMAVGDPQRSWLYAVVAALGSLAGCLILHGIGRKGGQAVLRWRFRPEQVEWVQAAFRRYDLLAVLIPSLLPPPCPFKIFVVSSGVFGMGTVRFALTVLVGRSARYLVESYLAARYGRQILSGLEIHGRDLTLGLVALALGFVLLRRLAGRARPLPGADGGGA